MSKTEIIYDVVAVGNAIVDVIAKKEDSFLAEHNLPKGIMSLIDEKRADELYKYIQDDCIRCSGGSAANTIAGIASLGGKPAFIGKVRDDELGQIFKKDISELGVHFDTAPLIEPPPTASCLIIVSPDAERTMNTYLGACARLAPKDITEELIKSSKITYMEGYLWDEDEAKAAMVKAGTIAHNANRNVSLTLSDPFCVDRHRGEFLGLIDNLVDILFCNEAELCSLYRTQSLNDAIENIRNECEITVVTCGKHGSIIVTADSTIKIEAEFTEKLVDTTGAGDSFAAGFLMGYAQEKPLETCAKMGGIAASEIISHYGARPETSLAELMKKKLG